MANAGTLMEKLNLETTKPDRGGRIAYSNGKTASGKRRRREIESNNDETDRGRDAVERIRIQSLTRLQAMRETNIGGSVLRIVTRFVVSKSRAWRMRRQLARLRGHRELREQQQRHDQPRQHRTHDFSLRRGRFVRNRDRRAGNRLRHEAAFVRAGICL